MKFLFPICIFLSIGFVSMSAQSGTKINKGNKNIPYFSCVHEEDSLENMMKLANDGNAEAAFCVGWHYGQNNTPNRSKEKFLKWLKKSATLGSRKAQSHYAQELELTSAGEASDWYVKAANQGDQLSLKWLSIVYYKLWLGSKDEAELITAYVTANLSGSESIPDPNQDRNGLLKYVCFNKILSEKQLEKAANRIKVMRSNIPNLPSKSEYEPESCR